MGWRQQLCDGAAIIKTKTLEQKSQKSQKVDGRGAFATFATIAPRGGNQKTSFPVSVEVESLTLGAIVNVDLWPDRTTVDGVPYSQTELTDLLSRGLHRDELKEVHMLKSQFQGVVIPTGEAAKIETRTSRVW